jgi:hypothetical protein
MPVSDLPYVTKGDKKLTLLTTWLANWVIKRLNILAKVTVKPDGAGKWECGEEGIVLTLASIASPAALIIHPYQIYISSPGNIKLRVGSHNGLPPSNISLEFEYTIANYVYAKLTTDGDGARSDLVIEVDSAEQSNDDPNGDGTDATFYDEIGRILEDGSIINTVINSRAWGYCNQIIFSY